MREIIASFARSGSPPELVFIAHPLHNGLIAWDRVIARLAREFGIADRVHSLPGGTPPELLRNAAGVVTINSTIGITALHAGIPVKALGNAIFDVPGLAFQAPLDRFWDAPTPPDPDLMAAFLSALVGPQRGANTADRCPWHRAHATSCIAIRRFDLCVAGHGPDTCKGATACP